MNCSQSIAMTWWHLKRWAPSDPSVDTNNKHNTFENKCQENNENLTDKKLLPNQTSFVLSSCRSCHSKCQTLFKIRIFKSMGRSCFHACGFQYNFFFVSVSAVAWNPETCHRQIKINWFRLWCKRIEIGERFVCGEH